MGPLSLPMYGGSLTCIYELDNESFPGGFCQAMERIQSGILIHAIFKSANRGAVETAPIGNVGGT